LSRSHFSPSFVGGDAGDQWRNLVFRRPVQVITMAAHSRNYELKKSQLFVGFPVFLNNSEIVERRKSIFSSL
jgi:hypothetical protein